MIKILIVSFFLFGSVYDITVPAQDGHEINLNNFRGKKILIVNTASGSEYAAQFGRLEELYQRLKDSLVIIAIPSNSFGNEPLTDSNINYIVNTNYHITYLLASKGEVTGDNMTGIFKWLTQKKQNGVLTTAVIGDFQKFLINEDGNLVGEFAPCVDPLSEELYGFIINEN